MISRRFLFLLYSGALLVPISACNNAGDGTSNDEKNAKNKPQTIGLVQLLIGERGNYFRKIEPGENLDAVKKSEKKSPDELDSNYLAYTLPMDTLHPDSVNEDIDSLNFFTISYNFDMQKLTDANEDIFLTSDSVASKLYSRLFSRFTAEYGAGIQADDCMIWSYKIAGKNMKVSLSDQSPEYDYGKLSLVFYSED